MIAIGDYVLATKYHDGDPLDQFAIGFYDGCFDHFGQTRHLVINAEGKTFRANGFRRVKKISDTRGRWLIGRQAEIEAGSRSLWGWLRFPMERSES